MPQRLRGEQHGQRSPTLATVEGWTMKVGDEVIRVEGERYQLGSKGTVVEVSASGERFRVYWHTVGANTKPKRTWVKASVIRLAAEAKDAAPAKNVYPEEVFIAAMPSGRF